MHALAFNLLNNHCVFTLSSLPVQITCSPKPGVGSGRGSRRRVQCKHAYEYYLGKYLTPMRYKKFKFLEIGLGCNMAYGAGLSAKLWLEFLPNADIWMADANAECVEAKKAEIYSLGNGRVTVVVGDQGDEQTLKSWLNQAGGQFDVIIDDGGHYNNQQWQTLKHLWPGLAPGGMLVVEDMGESQMGNFYGTINDAESPKNMLGRTARLMQDLVGFGAPMTGKNMRRAGQVPSAYYTLFPGLKAIDCGPEACIFFKCSGKELRCP